MKNLLVGSLMIARNKSDLSSFHCSWKKDECFLSRQSHHQGFKDALFQRAFEPQSAGKTCVDETGNMHVLDCRLVLVLVGLFITFSRDDEIKSRSNFCKIVCNVCFVKIICWASLVNQRALRTTQHNASYYTVAQYFVSHTRTTAQRLNK